MTWEIAFILESLCAGDRLGLSVSSFSEEEYEELDWEEKVGKIKFHLYSKTTPKKEPFIDV